MAGLTRINFASRVQMAFVLSTGTTPVPSAKSAPTRIRLVVYIKGVNQSSIWSEMSPLLQEWLADVSLAFGDLQVSAYYADHRLGPRERFADLN